MIRLPIRRVCTRQAIGACIVVRRRARLAVPIAVRSSMVRCQRRGLQVLRPLLVLLPFPQCTPLRRQQISAKTLPAADESRYRLPRGADPLRNGLYSLLYPRPACRREGSENGEVAHSA